MKKILALVLALTLALGTFSFAAAAPTDVEGTEFEDAVVKLVNLGIISGFPDGTYKPDEAVTRAQFAKIIVAALGLGESAGLAAGETKFSDLAADHWASGFVNIAVDLGIIAGYPDGTFLPEKEVTYAEAIKMIVAALGYTHKANDMGGYPTGYLAIAAEEGITKGIAVAENGPANRGDIAIMGDNALTVPLMVQTSWGENPQYAPDKDQTLMKKLGVEEIEGRVVAIPRVDSKLDDDEIRIDGEDGGVFEITAGVDKELAFGQQVTAFIGEDGVIGLVIKSDYYLDAIEADGDELTLVQQDKELDVADDADVYIDGEEDEAEDAMYAKVVLDEDGDVIFIDAYNWDGFIAVEDVDDEMVFGYGDELDAEDYTIVKEGMAIALEDIEEDDIIYYNERAQFAEIYNASFTGEVEEVYESFFEVDDEEIDITDRSKYVDGDDLEDFTAGTAEAMMDEGGDVTVFVDRLGGAVLVIGDISEAAAGSFYAYVVFAGDGTDTDRRGEPYWPIDVIDEDGKVLSCDLDEDVKGGWLKAGVLQFAKDDVVEIEVDRDDEVVAVNVFASADRINVTDNFKTDDSYVKGKKLQGSAVAFDIREYDGDEDDIDVNSLDDLKYNEIQEAEVYIDSSDRVVVMVVGKAGTAGETKEHFAVATGDANKLAGEETWRLTLNIDGEKANYYTEKDEGTAGAADVEAGDFLIVEIDGGSGEATEITNLTQDEDDRVITGEVAQGGISLNSETLEIDGADAGVYRLEDAVLLDADYDDIRLKDVSEGDTVTLLLVSDGSSFAAFAVVTAVAE